MRLVLSPYELSARSVAAMAALLLGSDEEGVLTLLPTPEGGTGREAVRDAAMGAPAFVQLMEAWRWSAPLWNAGVLSGHLDGRPVMELMREIPERIERTPWGRMLAPFLRAEVFQSGHESLHLIARDLLRGGGDPAVAIPITAGLESLASEHCFIIVREPLPSVVARFERTDRRPLARLSIPALLEASGETLMSSRERLAPELGALRAELSGAARDAMEGRHSRTHEGLNLAAERYERAFAGAIGDLRRTAFDQGRFKPAVLTLELGVVPADESLASGARALGLISGGAGATRASAAGGVPRRESAIVAGVTAVARLTVRRSQFDPPTGF